MKFYVDIAGDGVLVDQSAYIIDQQCNPKVGNGGNFYANLQRLKADFLTNKSTYEGWRGKQIKFMDDTDTYTYMHGYIQNVVNITHRSCVFVGYQAIRLLQDYPADYDPILYENTIKSIGDQFVQDRWDILAYTANALYQNDIVSVIDANKLQWVGHPQNVDMRSSADPLGAARVPDKTYGTTKDDINFDTEDYGKVATPVNYYIFGNDQSNPVALDHYWILVDFTVPKVQGTNFKACVLKIVYKGKNSHIDGLVFPYESVFIVGDAFTTYVTKLTATGMSLDKTLFDSVEVDTTAEVALSDYAAFNKFEVFNTKTHFTDTIIWEKDITPDMDITAENDNWYNKTSYNDEGIDTFDISFLIRVPGLLAFEGVVDPTVGIALFNSRLTVSFDSPQTCPVGASIISSNTTAKLTLSKASPFPINDGWSQEDTYFISHPLSTQLNDAFLASGADGEFTLSKDTVADKTDLTKHVFTPFLRILQLYSELGGKTYWEHNLVISWTSTFTDSTINFTETDVDNYPKSVKFNKWGDEAVDKIIVVGLNERDYNVPVNEPVTATGKVRTLTNPDIISDTQARSFAEALKTYLEKDLQTVSFDVRMTTALKTNMIIGKTADVSFESGNYVSITAGLILEVEIIDRNNDDYATVTITNKHL